MNTATETFIEPNTQAWDELWASFTIEANKRFAPHITDCNDTHNHESWQYHGTINGIHHFRHRWHPKTGRREYLTVNPNQQRTQAVATTAQAHHRYYGQDMELSGAIGPCGECISDADPGL